MLSEVTWFWADRCCMNPLIGGTQSSHTQKAEVEWWVPAAGEGECFMGTRRQTYGINRVLETDGRWGWWHNSVNGLSTTDLYP